MAPPNPKRPPRPPRPPVVTAAKKEDVELPFDDDEVAPLQEDDPRPQRVPQFPAGTRRTGTRPTGQRGGTKDHELAAQFDANEYSDPGFVPTFLYVEKGPGAGQLIPVKQGPLIIGRASICDLRLQHPSISRRHAQIMRQGDRFTLRDLGSQNGTFVNRVKIIGDLEIRIGDEIALGNALLKLRGSGVPPEKAPEAPAAPAKRKSRKGMSLTRVAIAAAVVGSAAAALLTVAVLKFAHATRQQQQQEQPTAALPSSTEGEAAAAAAAVTPVTAEPAREQEVDYEPPPPAEDKDNELAAATEEESPGAAKPIKAQEPQEAEEETVASAGKKSSGPRAASLSTKSSSSRKEKNRNSRSSAQRAAERQEALELEAASEEPAAVTPPVPVEPPAPIVDRADVIALYEKGDVDGALNLARTGKLEPLSAKLAEYQSAIASGQEALHARDTSRAIHHLSTALSVDQELSQGWAAHAGKLRKQLGRLYTQLGQDQLKAGAFAEARASFETALKYDPANTWAKSELQALNTGK
jgi:pSer/pThr/pTyr-binding forkhead associated (FHA) protein